MKRIIILIILIAFLLSGCWDKKEINQLAFVQGLGIEKGKDNLIRLVVQILKPGLLTSGGSSGTGGGGGGGGGGKPYANFEASGVDFAKAYANLDTEIPRNIFMQYNEIIFLDEEFARSGIYNTLDFMTRNPEFRRTAYLIVVSGGTIEDVFNLPSSNELEKYPYKEILGMITTDQNTSSSYICDLNEFIETLEIPKKAPIVGRLEVIKKDNKAVGARFTGSSIFNNDKFIGFLDEQDTKAIMLIMNKLKRSTLTLDKGIKGEKSHISVIITKSKSKIIPHIKDGDISFDININIEAAMNEQETKYDLTEPSMLEKLQQLLNKKIEDAVKMALEKLQKKYNADVVGFINILHQKNPKEWIKAKENWDEMYPNIKINVNAKSVIKRTGLSSKPIQPR